MSKRSGPMTTAERDALAESIALPKGTGRLACTLVRHSFRNLTVGSGRAQCLLCYGWYDDSRHP